MQRGLQTPHGLDRGHFRRAVTSGRGGLEGLPHILLLLFCVNFSLDAQVHKHRLYVCEAASKGYVVGTPLPPSGLFVRLAADSFRHLGFTHPFIQAADYDPRNPRILYIAAGNGCIRSTDSGETWRITTDWKVTELQDVSVDGINPSHVYIALPDGIGFSPDEGRTWERRQTELTRNYMQTIRTDRKKTGRILAGGEAGIFLSEDFGKHWRNTGPGAAMTMNLEQSPHDGRTWFATTQRQGVWISHNGGVQWTRQKTFSDQHTHHNTSFDPTNKRRIAIAGWGVGVLVSEDGGKTWQPRNRGLPSLSVNRVAFDPDQPGRLYASVHEEALYRSEDAGKTWHRAGLEGSTISALKFVPEPLQ
ncbi:MAG: hypothetical protein HYZ37_06940 [Candidatus Solibacter usitatus]|nr:hypothetical protein [Candidatus Solibacter usitatus]